MQAIGVLGRDAKVEAHFARGNERSHDEICRAYEPTRGKKTTDLPIRCSDELMELRFALLTVIKLWAHGLVGKAHTAPVLPYMAVVALNEKVPNIIRQSVRRVGVVDLTTTVL
jgi:hypothetical protein